MRRSSKTRNKNRKPQAAARTDAPSGWIPAVAILIVVVCTAAYGNTFNVPFLFDDNTAIRDNPSIRGLWPLWQALSPPHNGAPTDGRPILNLSLAVNYAMGGLRLSGYHAVNLAIHIVAALLLFGVVRRTIAGPGPTCRRPLDECNAEHLESVGWDKRSAVPPTAEEAVAGLRSACPTLLAAAVALIWALHPLQTESVTYISQRAESLVSLFYLLTLYCAIRSANSTRAAAWSAAAVASCALGMASKEVMVSAPLIVLLYDRTFLAGSFREALQKRRAMYIGLAATWTVLAALVVASAGRGGTAGFGLEIGPWQYALTQCRAIPHYLRLCFWPSGLCLDYGDSAVQSLADVWPQALGIVVFAVSTIAALCLRPVVGFLGAFFLAVLAPTSSIVPVTTQTIAEHRMYLPLVAVAVAVVVVGYLAGRRLVQGGTLSPPSAKLLGGFLAIGVVAALGVSTFYRNRDYRDEVSIWQDTAAVAPNNPRAYNNLGMALADRGRLDDAVLQYQKALELKPVFAEAFNNLGNVFARRDQFEQAADNFQKALQIRPHYADALNNFGLLLAGRNRLDEAIACYNKAIEFHTDNAEVHNNLGVALARSNRINEAIRHFRQALRMQGDHAGARKNLAQALALQQNK
jgi:protein O-mannosyl-transferase